MRALTATTVAILIVSMSNADAKLPSGPVLINNGYVTGNVYLDMSDDGKHAYAMGVVDGIMMSPFFGAESKDMRPFADCIAGMRSNQLQAITDAYLNAHPEKWDQGMHILLYTALLDACKSRGRPLR